jgi:hypothetical protein
MGTSAVGGVGAVGGGGGGTPMTSETVGSVLPSGGVVTIASTDPSTGGFVVTVPIGEGTGGWVVAGFEPLVTSVGDTRTPLIEHGIVRQIGGKVCGGVGLGAGMGQSFPALPQGVGAGEGISDDGM